MSNPSRITLELSARQRDLILRWGYPFETLKRELRKLASSKKDACVRVPRWEVEQLLGDLARSLNHEKVGGAWDELNELYEQVEAMMEGKWY